MNFILNLFGFFSGLIIYKRFGRFGPRLQNDLQLVYIHEGEAHITVDGTKHYLGPGQATLLIPGHQESFQFSERSRTRHGWCGIRRPEIEPDFLKQLEGLSFQNAFTSRMRALEKLFLPVRETNSAGQQQLHDALVTTMMIEFLQQTGILEQNTQPRHPAVERATAYMRAHFQEALNLPEIAAQTGITSPHLIRLFKDQLQVTPKAYLWQIRTEAAARLLRNTGLSAAEIAYECGFTNPHHFSRLFRKHYGSPPRAWRLGEWGVPRN